MRQRLAEQWQVFQEANAKKARDSDASRSDAVQLKQPLSTRITLALSLLGNLLISGAKFYAYSRTGHSSMFTEAVHTLVDVGNQTILGYGLRVADKTPDKSFQYGYGRAAFFFSLLSALSTFGFGSLYTGYHGLDTLLNPPEALVALPETWAVLGVSFLVDGFVLNTAFKHVRERANAAGVSSWQWILSFKDPFTVAVVFEDSAAVSGKMGEAKQRWEKLSSGRRVRRNRTKFDQSLEM